MKMAIQYWLNLGAKKRDTFVCFRGGYHGDTLGTMAISDFETGMHQAFGGILHPHLCAALPETAETDAELVALIGEHADRVAGIIVEPLVQGAGGMRFHDPSVLRRLREIADSCGVLLILDEIFTGFGRTGTMFACEAAGIVPDIVTLSKALTGRHLAARRDRRAGARLRELLVGRSDARADARTDLHGQCTGLRRGQRLARPVRGRRAAAAGRAHRAMALPPVSRHAAICRALSMCGPAARSAWSSLSGSTI